MKKIRKLLLAFCVFGFGTAVQAQEVIASGGDYYKSDGVGSISYTIGELAIASYSTANGILLEGFQAGALTVLSDVSVTKVDYQVSAYPNPVLSELKLKISDTQGKRLQYRIYDANGKLVKQNLILGDETTISFGKLGRATYVVKVFNANTELKSFTIVKN